MANPLKVLTALSASSGVAVSGSDGLKVQQGGLTVSAGSSTFAGTTISDLGTVTTADINGGTIDGTEIATSNITVGSGKTLNVSAGTLTLAAGQVGADKVAAGTFAAGTYSFAGSTISAATAITASALNITNQAAVGSLLVGGGFGSEGVTISTGGAIQADSDITVGGNIVADANENKSIFAAVTSNTITIGASGATVSIPGTASVGGNLTISGDLTVNGMTTTVSSQNVTIKDKNVILGVPDGGATATDAGADGGGITLSGSTDKTFQWSNATDSWTSSENLDLASGKTLKISSTDVIKQANILGGYATNASILTSGSANAILAVGSLMGQDTAVISGSNVVVTGPSLNFGPALLANADPELYVASQNVTVNTQLQVVTGSGHTFTNLNGDISGGKLDVAAALHTLDGLVTGGSIVSPTAYYGLRTVVSGTKQGDSDSVTFTISGSVTEGQGGRTPTGAGLTNMSSSNADTLISLMGGMSIDVAIKTVNTTTWTNDLVSVQVTASALTNGFYWPKIIVDAPSLAQNSVVRLIVVNENESVI